MSEFGLEVLAESTASQQSFRTNRRAQVRRWKISRNIQALLSRNSIGLVFGFSSSTHYISSPSVAFEFCQIAVLEMNLDDPERERQDTGNIWWKTRTTSCISVPTIARLPLDLPLQFLPGILQFFVWLCSFVSFVSFNLRVRSQTSSGSIRKKLLFLVLLHQTDLRKPRARWYACIFVCVLCLLYRSRHGHLSCYQWLKRCIPKGLRRRDSFTDSLKAPFLVSWS